MEQGIFWAWNLDCTHTLTLILSSSSLCLITMDLHSLFLSLSICLHSLCCCCCYQVFKQRFKSLVDWDFCKNTHSLFAKATNMLTMFVRIHYTHTHTLTRWLFASPLNCQTNGVQNIVQIFSLHRLPSWGAHAFVLFRSVLFLYYNTHCVCSRSRWSNLNVPLLCVYLCVCVHI